MKKYESAQELINELRDKGYKSREEWNGVCPGWHDDSGHTGCMSAPEGGQVHSCDLCEYYYTIPLTNCPVS